LGKRKNFLGFLGPPLFEPKKNKRKKKYRKKTGPQIKKKKISTLNFFLMIFPEKQKEIAKNKQLP